MCQKQRKKFRCEVPTCANPEYIPDPPEWKITPISSPDCHGVCIDMDQMPAVPGYDIIRWTCDRCMHKELEAKRARDRDQRRRDDDDSSGRPPPFDAHASDLRPEIKGQA
jgi:hypothetical protein